MGTEVVQSSGVDQLARNVPSALQAAGVRVVEEAGRRGVVIPPEVRQKANVLEPISEVAAADPNWTPSVRLAELDPEQHGYKQQGKRALNKQGLEVLAELAGVIDIKASRMRRDELADTEKFGWRAVARVRRSDGTVKTVEAHKTWDEEIAREEVVGTLRGDTEAARQSDFQRKWLAERQHASRKTESKAILAALRSVLKVPHVYTEQDFRKPFLVIGYSFTPDMSDPQTRDLVVRHGLGTAGDVFGADAAARLDDQVAALPPADMDPVTGEVPALPPAPIAETPPDEGEPQRDVTPVGEPLPSGDPDPDAPAEPPSIPADPDVAPFSEAPLDEEYQIAFTTVWPWGRHKEKMYGKILEDEPSYLHWIAHHESDQLDPKLRRAAQVMEQRHPDVVVGQS